MCIIHQILGNLVTSNVLHGTTKILYGTFFDGTTWYWQSTQGYLQWYHVIWSISHLRTSTRVVCTRFPPFLQRPGDEASIKPRLLAKCYQTITVRDSLTTWVSWGVFPYQLTLMCFLQDIQQWTELAHCFQHLPQKQYCAFGTHQRIFQAQTYSGIKHTHFKPVNHNSISKIIHLGMTCSLAQAIFSQQNMHA